MKLTNYVRNSSFSSLRNKFWVLNQVDRPITDWLLMTEHLFISSPYVLFFQVVFGIKSGLSTVYFPVWQWTFDFPCKFSFFFPFFLFLFFEEGGGLKHRVLIALHFYPICFGKCCPPITYLCGPKGRNSILQNSTFHFQLVLFFFPKWWANQIGSLQKKHKLKLGGTSSNK